MQRPVRFRFGNDFAKEVPPQPEPAAAEDLLPAPEPEPPVPMMPVAEHELLLDEACTAARLEGEAAGLASAEAMAGRMRAEAIEFLAREVSRLLHAAEAQDTARLSAALEVARAAAVAMARHALAAFPQAAITALLDESFMPLRRQPHLVVRCAMSEAGTLRGALEEIALQRGFEGRLTVRGEPGLDRPDARIEWPDGAISLDHASVASRISEAMQSQIDALNEAGNQMPAPAVQSSSAAALRM